MSLEDRIAVSFSRAVTRRRFLKAGVKAAAASGIATSMRFMWPGVAEAKAGCPYVVTTWGCYCSSTASCGASKCCYEGGEVATQCCGGAAWRCNYWPSGAFCWCSETCCLSGVRGYYRCCDCWQYGNYGSCGSGNTPCSCKGRAYISNC